MVRQISGAAINATLQRGRSVFNIMSDKAKSAWQQAGEQELVAVINTSSQKAAGSMPSSQQAPPSGALLQFSAPGADVTIFAPEAESSARQMAQQTGGQFHKGKGYGPLSGQLAQYGENQSGGGSSSQSGSRSGSTPPNA